MELPSVNAIIIWALYLITSLSFINLISLGRLSIKRLLKDSKHETAVLEFWIENIDHINISYLILKVLTLSFALFYINAYLKDQYLFLIILTIILYEMIIYILFYQNNLFIGSYISLYSVILIKSILIPYFYFVKSLNLLLNKIFSIWISVKRDDKEEFDKENDIEEIIIEDTNLLDKDERKMIMSIIQFNDTTVKEVMTPRTDLACVEAGASAKEIIDLINNEGHSRIPVYDGKIDNIIGIFYAKDLLKNIQKQSLEEINIKDFLRSAYFVPETKNISALLKEFMSNEVHIAIVVDEYGGTAGVVSIEDLLEEIVGEIRDEYDQDEEHMYKILEDNSILFDAKADIEVLEELFDIDAPEDDFESIGGLIFSLIGRVPSVGEKLSFQDLVLEIVEADERKISKIRVKKVME